MFGSLIEIRCKHPSRLDSPHAPVAQWIERLPPEQEVEGSNPFGRTNHLPSMDKLPRWQPKLENPDFIAVFGLFVSPDSNHWGSRSERFGERRCSGWVSFDDAYRQPEETSKD